MLLLTHLNIQYAYCILSFLYLINSILLLLLTHFNNQYAYCILSSLYLINSISMLLLTHFNIQQSVLNAQCPCIMFISQNHFIFRAQCSVLAQMLNTLCKALFSWSRPSLIVPAFVQPNWGFILLSTIKLARVRKMVKEMIPEDACIAAKSYYLC